MEVSRGLNDLEKYHLSLFLRLQRRKTDSMNLKVFFFQKTIKDLENYSILTNGAEGANSARW